MIDKFVEDLTVNELGNEIQKRMEELRSNLLSLDFEGIDRAAAARDLSLAITHLEDSLTRYNSARYRLRGTWKRNDPDR